MGGESVTTLPPWPIAISLQSVTTVSQNEFTIFTLFVFSKFSHVCPSSLFPLADDKEVSQTTSTTKQEAGKYCLQ